jgi:flagellar motor switch protein FliN
MAEQDKDAEESPLDAGGEEADAEMAEADLDTPLDGGDEEDAGVEEAIKAWEASGHPIDDEDEVVPVQFAQLNVPVEPEVEPDYSRLDNVQVEVVVEVGRVEKDVNYLLNLKEQDVIDLDKLTGEHFDILINRKRFAEGEIVVVSDSMAVRITKLYDLPSMDTSE